MMYQLNEMEMWRQRGRDHLREAENGRRGRRSRGTRRAALGFLTALLVTILVVVGAGGPASASTTFTVTNTFDPGDGNCNDSGCTLREAITAANNTPGADTINFNIQSAEVVHIISPSQPRAVITEAVTINGYSQPAPRAVVAG